MDIHNSIYGCPLFGIMISINTCIWCQLRSQYDVTITDNRYPAHVSKMAAREHVLGLAGEVMDTATARHSYDDFLDVNDLVRTTSANFRSRNRGNGMQLYKYLIQINL